MIRLDPDSSSEILQSTHIALAILNSVSASAWKGTGRIEEREASLTATIAEIFKGELRQPPVSTVNLHIRQYRPAGLRDFVVPGVWSRHELEPGAEFVLFSVSSSENAGEVFAEASLLTVEPARIALSDVRLALGAGTPELSLESVIARAYEELPAWGFLFANYLDARMSEAFFDRFPDFAALLRAVEDPTLSGTATRILLSAVYTKLMLYDPAPRLFLKALLDSTRRLLQGPRGELFRRDVLDTFLPNLLGIAGGLRTQNPRPTCSKMNEYAIRAVPATI